MKANQCMLTVVRGNHSLLWHCGAIESFKLATDTDWLQYTDKCYHWPASQWIFHLQDMIVRIMSKKYSTLLWLVSCEKNPGCFYSRKKKIGGLGPHITRTIGTDGPYCPGILRLCMADRFPRSSVTTITAKWGLVSPLARPYLERSGHTRQGGHNIVVPKFWKVRHLTTTLHGTDICPKNNVSY